MKAEDIDPEELVDDFISEIKKRRVKADTEAELRDEVNAVLDDYIDELNLSTSKGVERTTISGGRMDSVYGDLIIEFKKPKKLNNQSVVEEAILGRKESESGGLQQYLIDSAREDTKSELNMEQALSRKVGVGFDGYNIFFYKFHPGETVNPLHINQTSLTDLDAEVEGEFGQPDQVKVYSLEEGAIRFLSHLRALSRKALTPDELAKVFGPEGEVAKQTVRTLYNKLQDAREEGNPKVETLYAEWNRMFGIVYGEELERVKDEETGFGNIYGFSDDVELKPLLFSVHTYYALFSKLLVLDLFSTFDRSVVRTQDLLINNDQKLKEEIESIESGDQFELAGFEHFFEENHFSWYLAVWDDEIANSTRQLSQELGEFEPATPTIRPDLARDLLKSLYEDLVPRSVRHGLGEYLTPDWLAQYTTDRAEYEGEEDMIDPACGSGTFLMEAIRRVKANSEKTGQELVDEVTSKVVGFDLNPLSVMAARANYLIALGDDIYDVDNTTIPVYQSDSLLPPAKNTSFKGEQGYTISTVEGEFWIPDLGSRQRIEKFLNITKRCVDADYSVDEFWRRCQNELSIDSINSSESKEIFRKIKELDKDDRDSIWTQLLRNSLAPEFESGFSNVIGNPPWINWEHISEEYREASRQLWRDYKLYNTDGDYGARRLGGSKSDAAMLFTYVSCDRYLADDGELTFIIPETFFKSSEAAKGFRRFQLGEEEHLKVVSADDLSDFNPFEASNRTGIIRLEKNRETEYPVEYKKWTKKPRKSINSELSLSEVEDRVSIRELAASPIEDDDKTSPWLSAAKGVLPAIKEVLGESPYDAGEGMNNEGLNGVFNLSVVKNDGEDLLIQNLPDTGRKDINQITKPIEPDLIFPHLQGKDVDQFSVNYRMYTFFLKDSSGKTFSEDRLKGRFPKTHEFLKEFENDLLERSSYQLNYSDDDSFYDHYGAMPEMFSDYRVVWREQKTPFTSAVLEDVDDEYLGSKRLIPSHKFMLVGLDNRDEAHYLCALLNSSIVDLVVGGYTVNVQIGTHVTDNIKIPQFDPDNETHQRLAEKSKKAHKSNSVDKIISEIDELTGEIWDISEYIPEIHEELKN